MKKKSSPDESKYLAKLREPEFVMERLEEHRKVLAEDLRLLRLWWPGYMHNVTFLKLDDPASYLRSKLTIPEAHLAGKKTDSDNTLSARHRLALEYCRTLGVVGDAVDRLYQRIVSGDVTDKRAVETEADDAFAQLDAAIAEARTQWKVGEFVIKTPAEKTLEDSAFVAGKTLRESADQSKTIIALGKGCYRIANSRPYRVTDSEDAVLTAFLKYPAMEEQELDQNSGFNRSRDILRDLETKYDGKFAPAIHRPGGKGKGGYHVSIRVDAKPSA